MADDGNGKYKLKSNKFEGDNIFQQQAASGVVASADHVDSLMVDIKNALNNRLNIDGSKPFTNNLDLGGNNIVNIGNTGATIPQIFSGTFTPSFKVTDPTSITHTVQNGNYVVVGNLLFFDLYIDATVLNDPHFYINLEGLPYTPTADSFGVIGARKGFLNTKTLTAVIEKITGIISLYEGDFELNQLTYPAKIDSGDYIIQMSGNYQIDADDVTYNPGIKTYNLQVVYDQAVTFNSTAEFNDDCVFNALTTFDDDVTMTSSLTVPDINGRSPAADGAKLDTLSPNTFHGMSMTSISLQTAAAANTGYPVTINNIHVDGGLTHGALPASAFTIIENGVYELCFQPWMKGSAGNLMEFWWEVDTGSGFTTIAESVTQTENHSVIEQRKFCKVVTRLNAGDIVRAMWATGSTAMQINVYASIVGAAVPTVQMDIVRLAD